MTDPIDTLRPGIAPEDGGFPGVNPRTAVVGSMICDYDVSVPMRDGTSLSIDVFRPADEATPAPVLIAWGPYGKHAPLKFNLWPGVAVSEGELSPHTAFEAPDPVDWTAHGYAVINVDPRGTWDSDDVATFQTVAEGEDFYDLIEWAGVQPWSNGRVGLAGVSYLAMGQWQVAAMRPPHLKAINPWEGLRDMYRELVFHGGIPDHQFVTRWQEVSSFSRGRVESLPDAIEQHPLFDEYWQGKVADLSRADVPAYVLVGWADQGCHTRGTLDAFVELGSERKWLETYAGKKLNVFYSEEYVAKQRAFFDRFLKSPDVENEVDGWPRVRVEVSASTRASERIESSAWPLPEVAYRAFALDIPNRTLVDGSLAAPSREEYDSEDEHASLRFRHTFTEDTEIVGSAAVRLWMAAPDATDLDVFVALEKYDRDGNRVGFHYLSNFEDGAVALGWLRASHRALDAARSTPTRPVHSHTAEEPIPSGGIVPLDIEIWASASSYAAGESIELQIQGSDVHKYAVGLFAGGHPRTRNRGTHVLYSGGEYDSRLLLPVVR